MLSGVFVLDALILAAVFCAVVLAGTQMARPFLVGLAGNVPLIGGGLASAVDRILGAWQGALAGPADAVLPLLTSLLQWLTGQAHYYLLNVVRLAQSVHNAFWRLQQLNIPHLLDLFVQRLEGLIADARDYASLLVHRAGDDFIFRLTQARDFLGHLIDQEVVRAKDAELGLENFAKSEFPRIERQAFDWFNEAKHDAELWGKRAIDVGKQLWAGEELLRRTADDEIRDKVQKITAQVEAQPEEFRRNLERERAEIEKQAADTAKELGKPIEEKIDDILKSPGWVLLKSLVEIGDKTVETGTNQLVALAFKMAREQIANMPAWTKTQEANLEVIFDALKRDLAAK